MVGYYCLCSYSDDFYSTMHIVGLHCTYHEIAALMLLSICQSVTMRYLGHRLGYFEINYLNNR